MNGPTLDLSPLRQALTSLEDGLDVVRDGSWFNQQNEKVRNTTAHTYDHQKAQQVYEGTQAFMQDARALLAKLEDAQH